MRRVRRRAGGGGQPPPADMAPSVEPVEPVCFATLAALDDYVLIPVSRRRADMFRPDLSDAELVSWIHGARGGRIRAGSG